MNYVNGYKQKLIEGELRCAELLKYLEDINAVKCVFLSEDASGIISKIEYDPKTNQLVGLVLPLNGENGMPISFSFMASSSTDIQDIMQTAIESKLLYLVMAQPLIEQVPPFVLQIFGTDGKFESKNVLQRFQHTIAELKK